MGLTRNGHRDEKTKQRKEKGKSLKRDQKRDKKVWESFCSEFNTLHLIWCVAMPFDTCCSALSCTEICYEHCYKLWYIMNWHVKCIIHVMLWFITLKCDVTVQYNITVSSGIDYSDSMEAEWTELHRLYECIEFL